MRLLDPAHLLLLTGIAIVAALLTVLARRHSIPARQTRIALASALAANEVIWYIFRYTREGIHPNNLPLQLCDITPWAAVAACLTLNSTAVEFGYFAGILGSGMALLTPDLWAPWPSYPAIYFFVAHGLVLITMSVLVFGQRTPLRPGAPWRAFALTAAFAAIAGTFNAFFGTNYMYLSRKPGKLSLLNVLGPWPVYLFSASAVGLLLFWMLWLPVRPRRETPASS